MGSYIPNTGKEQLEMLKSMGYSSMDDLFAAIPDDMKLKDGLDLPEGKSELDHEGNRCKKQSILFYFPRRRSI